MVGVMLVVVVVNDGGGTGASGGGVGCGASNLQQKAISTDFQIAKVPKKKKKEKRKEKESRVKVSVFAIRLTTDRLPNHQTRFVQGSRLVSLITCLNTSLKQQQRDLNRVLDNVS
ncbi:hypothetical protein M0802_011836 [Mischocyttarus mexicanus]|nr:hypothetical protein M0802_011836 [Mischocyttarus mexicanus]